MVRATMAEEQLKSLQEHLGKVTLDYQKKIVELKKSVRIHYTPGHFLTRHLPTPRTR